MSRNYTNCTNKIPAELNITHVFVDPTSFVIKAAAAPVWCNNIALLRWRLNGRWYCAFPQIRDCAKLRQIPVKPIAVDDLKVMSLGLGRSIYVPTQLEEFVLQGEPGDMTHLLVREHRAGVQWKSSRRVGARTHRSGHGEPHQRSRVPSGASVPGDWPNSHSGPADTVPGGNPEDDAGHHDQGDCDCEDKRLWMVADGSLLGHFISDSSGVGVVGNGQGHTIGKIVMYQRTAKAVCIHMEEAEVQRLNLDRLVNWSNEFLGRLDSVSLPWGAWLKIRKRSTRLTGEDVNKAADSTLSPSGEC